MGAGSGIYMHVSPKRCKIEDKLALIINRKSYMSFRLVPKSVTLNGIERRNDANKKFGNFRDILRKRR